MSDERTLGRLRRLGMILDRADGVALRGSSEADPAEVHLHSIPAARIRQITEELERRSADPIDEIDILTIRVLLNEYGVAVSHLRSMLLLTDQRLSSAAVPIKDASKFLRRMA